MPDPSQIVLEYLQAALATRERLDRYTFDDLEGTLSEAASGAQDVYHVTYDEGGGERHALLTLGPEGATLYRLHADDLALEQLSFGTLRNGLISEIVRLPARPGDPRGTVTVHYRNPDQLEIVGGWLTFDVRHFSDEATKHLRDVLRPTG